MPKPNLPKRILAADDQAGFAMLQATLDGAYDWIYARTLHEAVEQLREGLDMIVCGVHFDESRMFDFLRISKAAPATKSVPFLCYRDLDSDLGPAVLEAMEIAVKALGAVAFVDMFALKEKHGTADADARFRELLLSHFAGSQ